MCGSEEKMHALKLIYKAEGNLWETVLSFCHVVPNDRLGEPWQQVPLCMEKSH